MVFVIDFLPVCGRVCHRPVLGCVVDLALVGSRGASAVVGPAAGLPLVVLALFWLSVLGVAALFIEVMRDILDVFRIESFSAVAFFCVS